jgi:hypothetical protein
MNRSATLLIVILLFAANGVCQAPGSADPCKPSLDRLEALTHQPEAEWRFHIDVPHPEDAGLNDSEWSSITVKTAPDEIKTLKVGSSTTSETAATAQ